MTIEEMLVELKTLTTKINHRTQYRASEFDYAKSQKYEVKVYANDKVTSKISVYWINKESYEVLANNFEKHREKLMGFLSEGGEG